MGGCMRAWVSGVWIALAVGACGDDEGSEGDEAASADVVEAAAHFVDGRRLLLERGEPVQHVVRVDRVDGRQVVRRRRPDLHPLTENTRAPRGRAGA